GPGVMQGELDGGLGEPLLADLLVHGGAQLLYLRHVVADSDRREVPVDDWFHRFYGFAAPPRAAGGDGLADALDSFGGADADQDEALPVDFQDGELVRAPERHVDDGCADG